MSCTSDIQRQKRIAHLPVLLTLLMLGTAISIGLFALARLHESNNLRASLNLEATRLTGEFYRRLISYEDVLRALNVVFLGSDEVSRSEFQTVANEVRKHYYGIQALEWIPVVTGEGRALWEQQTRESGVADFEIRERAANGQFVRAGARHVYWPIYYVEPEASNRVVLGYDLATGPTTQILNSARERDRILATPLFTLAQETGKQKGMVLVLPVKLSLRNEQATKTVSRVFAGFLQCVFRVQDMLDSIWNNSSVKPAFEILIMDVTRATREELVYYCGEQNLSSSTPELIARFYSSICSDENCDIFGRKWRIGFRPTQAWISQQQSVYPILALVGGLLFTILILLHVHTLYRRSEVVERKVEERTAELKESQEKLHLALASARMGIWEHDLENGLVIWSDELARLFHHQPGQFDGRPETIFALLDQRDLPTVKHAQTEALRQGQPYEVEFRVNLPDGSQRWISSRAQHEFNAEGKPIRIRGVAVDVTQRKLREKEMHMLAAAIHQSSDMILIVDPQGGIQYPNPTFEKISGKTSVELNGHHFDMFFTVEGQSEIFREISAQIQAVNHWHGQLSMISSGGQSLTVEALAGALVDEDQQLQGYVFTARDITRELNLEEQLRQAQKMEAIGLLAGGIAHDFNNLLQVINGCSDLAMDAGLSVDERRAHLQEVINAGERAAQLTRQLLAFSRKQTLHKTQVNVNKMTIDLLKMIQRLIGVNIEVELKTDGDLPLVLGDKGHLEQVLLNLCVNARDAMPQGGRLVIKTQVVSVDGLILASHPTVKPGRFILLEVTDNGQGMDKQTMSRIFEPFFTTKESGRGTGLGLSVAYGIVQQHGGFISVYSEPGLGSTFKIFLPMQVTGPLAGSQEELLNEPNGGQEMILLAEDASDVRMLACKFLEHAGYRVLMAADGVEACQLYNRHPKEIQLLVFDLVMPNRNGLEAFREIRQMNPAIPAIFCSGFSERIIAGPEALPQGTQLLSKPYLKNQLLTAVRQVLDAAKNLGPVA